MTSSNKDTRLDGAGDGSALWTEDLTEAQLQMVISSGDQAFGMRGNGGCGVELNGSAAWRVARALVAKGLGDIEGGAPNGSEFPGLYFNNREACRILHEFDEFEEDED